MSDDSQTPRDPRELAETRTSWGRGETVPAGPGRSDPGTPLLAPGAALGERYQIVRLIARGGMGEVYEALDRELGERVALKTIRSELAASPASAERFRREVQLARRVTHPNVSRLFDLGSAEGPQGSIFFLTMELLDGESLADRIRRTGPLDAAAALPILRQVAAGLDAAHRAGVVHRDFKSGNVMLVGGESAGAADASGGGVRAVVTDFGLARQVAAEDPHALTLSGGGLVGSPAYMAPEQVEGLEITRAADVYALGVVLFEMRTGRLPFSGATPLSVAVQRLSVPPPPPRTIDAAIEPAWESAILRCMARDPAQRFASAGDVVAALESTASPAPRRLLRAGVAVTGLLLLALAATALWRARPVSPADRPTAGAPSAAASGAAAAAPRRPVVAVLGFKNLSGRPDDAWISTALGEMLATELAGGERVRIVPGEVVARARQGLALSEVDSLAADTLHRLRSQLGADYFVLGAYAALGTGTGERQLRLDIRLQDAERGEIVTALAETGSETALFELVGRAGGTLRERLGAGSIARDEAGVRSALPVDPRAARLYSEGLARLRAADLLGARDRLEESARVEPTFALAHAALAEAFAGLGYDQKARESAARAMALSGGLAREERLLVEGRQADATRDWTRAIEAFGALYGFFPDHFEYGLRLARALANGGRAADALRTIDALRALPPAARDDARLDLLEAFSASTLGDSVRAQEAAARAATRAAAAGATLIAADAKVQGGWALMRLGQPARAVALFEDAHRAYAAAGHGTGAARATLMRGRALADQARHAEARRCYEEALAAFREAGDQRGTASALNDLGNLLYYQGDLAGARRNYEQTAAIHRETGDANGLAGSLGNIANILDNQGDLPGARTLHEEAIALFRSGGDEGGVARSTFNIGLVLAKQGQLAEAQLRFEEALASHRKRGYKRGIAFATQGLGEIALARGDLPAARRAFESSLALREELGEKDNAAQSRTMLARTALEEGDPANGERLAREAERVFADQDQGDLAASAMIIASRALLDQGQAGEALEAARRAEELAATSQAREVRIEAAIALARADAAAGHAAEARVRADAALAEADRCGLVPLALEARLARAEIDLRRERSAAALSEAGSLERDADAAGFTLVARRARALLVAGPGPTPGAPAAPPAPPPRAPSRTRAR